MKRYALHEVRLAHMFFIVKEISECGTEENRDIG
jgi:hypothetical protein